MGKVSKNKKKSSLKGVKNHKSNGNTSKSSNGGETSQELQSSDPSEQILAYLQKPNIEEKICGFQIMATVLESEESSKVICNKNILKVAMPLIHDDSPLVRCAAAGTIRNFSALGMDYCDHLIENNAINPLMEFFKKHGLDWKPSLSPTGKLDEEGEAFLHCVHILWNLCECSGLPIRYVNQTKLITLLRKCLNIQIFGIDIVIAVLHCLCVILEDNSEAIPELLISENELKSLSSIDVKSKTDLLIKILALGILMNLKDINAFSSEEKFQTMNCIAEVLSDDLRQTCNSISSKLPVNNALMENEKLMLDCELKKNIDDLKHAIDAQQTALELVTNLCSGDDDPENEEEIPDEIYFDECDSASAVNGNDVSGFVTDKLPIEIIEAITNNGLVKSVWSKTDPLPENVVEILNDSEEGKRIKKRFFIFQSRAYFCMNNMVSSLPLELLEDYEGLYSLWTKIMDILFQKDNPIIDEEIFESGTAVMRTILSRFDLKNKTELQRIVTLFENIDETDIQLIIDGINQCQNPEIRTNLIRMLGMLAQILIFHEDAEFLTVLVYLADFLTTSAFKEMELWVLADILDTLMDVFSEDKTDMLAAQVHLIEKITALYPIFRSKVKDQRKKLGDHYATVSTVATNLPRFIKYKRHRVQRVINI